MQLCTFTKSILLCSDKTKLFTCSHFQGFPSNLVQKPSLSYFACCECSLGFLVASLLSPLALALTGAYREISLLIYTPSSFGFLLLLCQVIRAGSALCEKFYSRSKVGFKRRKGRRRVRRRKGMLWHLQPSCTDAYLSCFELSLKLLNSRTGTLFFFFLLTVKSKIGSYTYHFQCCLSQPVKLPHIL